MVTRKLILKKEVDIEAGAKALWGRRNTPWEEAGETAQKEYRRQAIACAEAWGLRYE